jgi:hypothetical protein
MTPIPIAHTTEGAHREKRRNDAVGLPIVLFFSFFLSSFFFSLSLRYNWPSLSTIKREGMTPYGAHRKKAIEAYTHTTHSLGSRSLSRPFVTSTTNPSASNMSRWPLDVETFSPNSIHLRVLFAHHPSLDTHTCLLVGVNLKH